MVTLAAALIIAGWSTAGTVATFVLGTVLTILALAAAIGTLGRSRKGEIITELEQLNDLHRERDHDCRQELAEVRGQLKLLESDLIDRVGDKIATAVVVALKPILTERRD